ncbi:Energy-coupling factor transporter transmembrane protein EcfT [bioreactor metagenome]|uniref:Energy-coupling factor transporter transmembrane protein EcfT n=1 Tax=bioreactor metagenome TaxID=1076179 RepID=A0A645CX33_9ZZZZ
MIKDITIGQYYPGASVLHRSDARTKILLTLAFIIVIFMCKTFFSLGLMIVFLTGEVIISKVPFKTILKSLKPIIPLIILTALLNIFYSDGGQSVIQFWKINITDKALYTALFIAVRITCLIICSSLLTYTTTPTMLTDGIEKLLSPLDLILKPFHMQVHTLAMMMTLALRFIPTLIEEIDKIMNAQKARGADLESGSFIDRIKALVPIIIPLFISSFRRAYELAFAMDCRCYTGGKGRTRMKQMKFGFPDVIVAVAFIIMCVGIYFLNVYTKTVI